MLRPSLPGRVAPAGLLSAKQIPSRFRQRHVFRHGVPRTLPTSLKRYRSNEEGTPVLRARHFLQQFRGYFRQNAAKMLAKNQWADDLF
jgi:hypothetical protein